VNEAIGTDFNSDGDVLDSKITIYFDKVMDAATLTSAANYLLTNKPLSDIKGASLAAAADNKSVTITINRSAPDTQFAFATTTDLRVIAVKDAAGNTLDASFVNADLGASGKISQFVPNVAFNTIIDTTKVEAIAKNQIKVYAVAGTFIESIDPNKVKFDKNNTAYPTLQVTGVTLAADKKSAVLSLNSNLGADAKIGTDAVTLCADVDAVKTTTGVKSQVVPSGSGVTIIDKIKPTVQPVDGKFEVAGDKVTIKFDEALDNDAGTASETAAGFALTIKDSKGNQLSPADYAIAFANGNKDIEIQITKAGFNDKVTVALANNVAIKDIAGNFANDFAATESKDAVATAIGVTLGATVETTKGVAAVKGKATAENAIVLGDLSGVAGANIAVKVGATTFNLDNDAIKALGTPANNAALIAALENAVATDSSKLSSVATVSVDSNKLVVEAKAAVTGTDVSVTVTKGTGTDPDSVFNFGTPVTVAGVTAQAEVGTTTVTAGASNNGTITVNVNDGTLDKDVVVAVANGDTAAQVAGKIVAALNADAAVSAKYAATQGAGGSAADVILTQKAGQEADVTLSVTLK